MSPARETPWELPPTWAWAQFGEAASIAQDLVDPKSVPRMPHIAPNNIEGGSRRLLDFQTVEADGVISPKQRFVPGQVLFSKIRPYLRKAILATFEGVCSADMYPIWPSAGLQAEYLLYWLTAEDFRDIAAPHQGRTLLPKINQEGLNSTPLPLPPLAEQRRIVAKLNALTARTARARADLDRVPRLAERQRRSVLRAAFAGNLTSDLRDPTRGLAENGWRTTTLGEICDVQSGLALGKKRAPGTQTVPRPYLRVANVQRGWLRLDEVKWMDVTADEFRRLRLEDGDILMNEGGDLDKLGRGWVWRGEVPDCVHQNHVFRLRLRDAAFPPEYVSHYANELGQEYVLDAGKQTTNLASISRSRVCAMPIVLPPHQEAHGIVRRIAHAFAEIERLVAEAAAARRLLDRLDQAILAKAFRGELVPQDPADEPASVLLDRMRAERAASRVRSRRGRRVAA